MKFKKVRKGEYRTPINKTTSLWVVKESRGWFWFIAGVEENGAVWEIDNVGPFARKREAIEDAIANYRDLME